MGLLRVTPVAMAVLVLASATRVFAGPGEILIQLRPESARRSDGAPTTPGSLEVRARLAAEVAPPHQAALAASEITPFLSAAASPPARARARSAGRERLGRCYLVRLPVDVDAETVAAALEELGVVEWATPNRSFALRPPADESPAASSRPPAGERLRDAAERTELVTNDPRREDQWYLDQIDVESAWSVTRGVPEVLIAVIDTGVSRHTDLVSNLWQNDDLPGNASSADDQRDQDGDGIVEEWERQDDDDNGYVDDTWGYDFVDAPRIGGADDPVGRDNDPTDGSGHGTMVAGLIAATSGNDVGIAGVAPECRIMPVRAGFNPGLGFLGGVLEEDDAAAAIVYAVDNGAAIINMSWGDTLFSPLVADAIIYASDAGVVLVGSAGNSRFDGVHYPSSFDGVVSVGATDRDDQKTSFSNFGPTLDVMAPGDAMLSTVGDSLYFSARGTSFAAPLVAGIAALLKSRDPNLTPAEIEAILEASAIDIFPPGFDLTTGHGRVDAGRALRIDRDASVRIIAPENGGGADSTVAVRVTVEGLGIEWFEVDWGVGREPASFQMLARIEGRQAVDDVVADWTTAELPAGEYTVRLRASDRIEGLLEARALVRVDHTPPAIDEAAIESLWVAERQVPFIFFETDDIARAEIDVFDGAGDELAARLDGAFVTRVHTVRLAEDLPAGQYRLELRARNAAGLAGPDPPVELAHALVQRRARTQALVLPGVVLAPAELGPDPRDLNADGSGDLVVMEEVADAVYGPAHILAATGDDAYTRVATLPRRLLPRAAADTDNDGRMEILAIGQPEAGGLGTFLFESADPESYPLELAWADSTLAGFAIGFARFDGILAMLSIRGDSLAVYSATGDASTWSRQTVPNFAGSGSLGNTFGAADLDGDGRTELVVGDTEGHLLVYRYAAGLTPVVSMAMAADATPRIAVGDVLGDPTPEIVVAQEEGLGFVSEALFERRRHRVRIFRLDGGADRLDELDSFGIAGIESGVNSVRVANLDADPAAEIVVVAAPDLYVFEQGIEPEPEIWTPSFHADGARSRSMAIGDADGDGRMEVFVRTGAASTGTDAVTVFEAPVPVPGPTVPDGLRARIFSREVAELSWNPGAPSLEYRVYRALGTSLTCSDATLVRQVALPSFTDSTLAGATEVAYRVSAYDPMSGEESACSALLVIRPQEAPRVTGVRVVHARALSLMFSEPMSATADRLENYRIFDPDDGRVPVITAIPVASGHGRLLTVAAPLGRVGGYRLEVGAVSSVSGAPLAGDGVVTFEVGPDVAPPTALIIVAGNAAGRSIALELSDEPAPPLGHAAAGYRLEAGGRAIVAVGVEGAEVTLELDNELASGVYRVGLDPGLTGLGGAVVVPGSGDAIELEIAGAIVYPNPYDARRATSGGVTLTGIDARTEVVVMDALGREIERTTASSSGIAFLEVRANPRYASGVYVVRFQAGGSAKLGTVAVLK